MKEMIITSSVLIAVLLLLRVIFARKVRRVWIYAAWLLVALRLLIPVQIGQLPFSVLTSARPITEAISNITDKQVAGVTQQEAYRQVLQNYIEEDRSVFLPEVQTQIQNAADEDRSNAEIAEIIGNSYPEDNAYTPAARPQVQQKVEETAHPITLGQIAMWVWLAGVAAMVIWLAAGNLLLGRNLRETATPMQCCSPLPVYVSDEAISPCLVGLIRPAVYLTPESASDENITGYVLAHELTHYAHKDHIWALVRCICLCVFWFNPLVWVAAWFSRRDCELACDEGALKRLGEKERVNYGKALLQVVSQSSVPGRLMLTATTMAETKQQLKQRVSFISRKPKWSAIAAVCMALVCTLVAGCVATGPVTSEEPTQGTQPPAPNLRPWEVSEEVKLQLKQDYVEYMSYTGHSCTVEDVQLAVISQVETGYAVAISCKCGSVKLDAPWTELFGDVAADLEFYMPEGWFLQFCKDGQFNTLSGAYNQHWLNYAQLRTVWNDYHWQVPKALKYWQKVNGQMQPPERDPSGLAYTVNEDGKTCTVTGMGVCRDADVVIPEYIDGYQVTAIGELAFWAQYGITSVTMPDSVTSIGSSAFEFCDQMKSIYLSRTLERIGIHAFIHCKALETIHLPDSLVTLGGGAFSDCSSLTAVTIPSGVTELSAGVFDTCSNLKAITLHNGITAIGEMAFMNCSSLTEFDIPDQVAKIEDFTFAGCVNLRRVRIPDGVLSIGSRAFSNCSGLQEVVIPDSVQAIGQQAFQNCTGLTTLSIGKGFGEWNFEVFYNCPSLQQIQVSAENPHYRVRNGCLIAAESKTLLLAAVDAVIPADGSVRHIGDWAFYGQTDLRQIWIPEGIESIGRDSFFGCSNLAYVQIPVSMQLIDRAFGECDRLETIHYSGTMAQWKAIRKGTVIGDTISLFVVQCTDGDLETR